MKKHSFKLTNGVVGMYTEEEISMVLELESRGYAVHGIKTESGVVKVTFGDGTTSEYLKIVM